MSINEKAIRLVCLFLLPVATLSAQEFPFNPSSLTAYRQVLNLDLKNAEASSLSGIDGLYVQSLSEVFELLLTEDPQKFDEWETRFQRRLDRKADKSPHDLFLRAEMHLQWSFVYLKFGHEFDAALQLRKSYNATRELRAAYPDYKPALKTSGLLNVMVGSVPDRYTWVLDLLDMHGNVSAGLNELNTLSASHQNEFAFEAGLWHAFILGFVLQQPGTALQTLEQQIPPEGNLTALFLAANLCLKNSNSAKALTYVSRMEEFRKDLALPYAHYLKGELLLHKGDYEASAKSFLEFIRIYKGENYLKDAWYKTGICQWLVGKKDDARQSFATAKRTGNETTEADKYAARALAEEEPPPIPLIRLRYYTDGGYYEEARQIIAGSSTNDFKRRKDQIEFTYRKARLYHKQKENSEAQKLYLETIVASGDEEWYFAPNACLQIGYLAVERGEVAEAEKYFRKALSYKKHEYKNSIDSKARSALDQLGERK